ncbi:MAG: uroporphyrinogen-III synthase [Anaerolineae bacterium]
MTNPLRGKTIVNTRAAHQAEALNDLLRAAGAIPLNYPAIAIAPPLETASLDRAIGELCTGGFEWLVLTSTNAVSALADRLQMLKRTAANESFRTAAVGPATAHAAREQLGLEVVDLPPHFSAEALANYLPLNAGERVLLPESVIAASTLADGLAARGALVHRVDAYRTICGQGGADDLLQRLHQKRLDALSFTSASTVTCFLDRLKREGGRHEDALHICAACIGPSTAAAARDHGFTIVIAAEKQTLEGLIETLHAYFTNRVEMERP